MAATQGVTVLILSLNAFYRINPDDLEEQYATAFHVLGGITVFSQLLSLLPITG